MSSASVKVYGVPVKVDFSYEPPSRGHRNSMGVPEEPDYPEEIDIEEVYLGGYEILCLMSDEAIAKARDAVLNMKRGPRNRD